MDRNAEQPGSPPTLLVFTLGERRECRRRRLLPASLSPLEHRLHRTCLESTLAAGREAGCRLEVSSPLEIDLPAGVHRRPQRGRDFGSRLERALAESFADREGPVLLVGSDVPDLEAAHLRRTLEALAEDPERVVIGPSPDGGFYLLAAARPLGDALVEVRWCCRDTLRGLKRALRRQGRPIALLPPLADLDRRADLEHWLAAVLRARLCRRLIGELIAALAHLKSPIRSAAAPLLRFRAAYAASSRGPPAPLRLP